MVAVGLPTNGFIFMGMTEKLQEHHVQFFTAVCKDWLPLLQSDAAKKIILDSLKFCTAKGWLQLCAYVIMPHHLHFIWRIAAKHRREDVQRDFLKFTARSIIALLQKENSSLYQKLHVQVSDRNIQVWKRNSMCIDLYSEKFFTQKLTYIHANPCQPKWMLAPTPLDYPYSSAAYYENGIDAFDILRHYHDI